MPTWLWRLIVCTCASICLLSVAQWASCRFYVLPTMWPIYISGLTQENKKPIDAQQIGCNDVDARTVAVMMSVLTTLISLSRKAE